MIGHEVAVKIQATERQAWRRERGVFDPGERCPCCGGSGRALVMYAPGKFRQATQSEKSEVHKMGFVAAAVAQ